MLYEDQAASFDARVAIPAEAVEAVAAAVVGIAGLRQGDTLLEVGAGTGMLSLPLIRRPIHYIGFDRSPAMLAVFREKVEEARSLRALVRTPAIRYISGGFVDPTYEESKQRCAHLALGCRVVWSLPSRN